MPVLVAIDFDRDPLPGTISGSSALVRFVEAPEQRVPCLLVLLSAGEIPEQERNHVLHRFLMGVSIIPPVPRHTIPGGGIDVAHPNHSAWVDPSPLTKRVVGPLTRLKVLGQSHPAPLLRKGLRAEYEGHLHGPAAGAAISDRKKSLRIMEFSIPVFLEDSARLERRGEPTADVVAFVRLAARSLSACRVFVNRV